MLWIVFLSACLLGTAQHFLFDPLGRPRSLMWLLPVSESPWEHFKLAFWPLGGALALAARHLAAGPGAFACAWLAAAAHAFCTMLGIYYFYRSALGAPRPILWADIGNYTITMLCGWRIGLRALSRDWSRPAALAAAVCLLACALFFSCAAALPPELPLFREEHRNIS